MLNAPRHVPPAISRHVPPAISRHVRLAIIVALAIACVAATFAFVDPFPQDERYHAFAGPRMPVVVSNLGFLIVAIGGFLSMRRIAARLAPGDSIVPVWMFFLGIFLTFLGSSWYHMMPDDTRLLADRFGIAVSAAALIAIVIGDRAIAALIAFELAGFLGLAMWLRFDDLRLYGFVQFFPAVVILAVAFMPRYTRSGILLAVVAGYAVAKVCEVNDREILDALGVSGHTLKHVVASLATGGVWWWLRAREGR